ncbi:MAG: hypothetical protein GC164_15545 [Phycisphaera sp.]|nr:hypothetical protein [Phycisphaera sp.]
MTRTHTGAKRRSSVNTSKRALQHPVATPPNTPSRPARGAQRASTPVREANEQAMRLTGRPYVSHSQLSTFRGCPRKFAFVYVEKAQPEFQPVSLVFGGAIHAAMEMYFRRLLEGLPTGEGDLMHAFMAAWQLQCEKLPGVAVKFNKNESMSDVVELAQRMLGAFRGSAASQPHGEIVGIEEELTTTLAEDLPDVLARVDLVTRTPGSLHVVDWKTSRSRWTPDKAVENAEQLRLYARTVQRMARGLSLPVSLHFVVVTKAKSPVVQVLDVPHASASSAHGADQEATVLTENVRQVWSAIKAGHDYAAPSPMMCSTCPFKGQCPAFVGSVTTPI